MARIAILSFGLGIPLLAAGGDGGPVSLGITGDVQAIAVNGRHAYVGGGFSRAGETPVANLAHWDGTNWSSLGGFDGPIQHIVATGNYVYVAGSFLSIDGLPAAGAARWDGSQWLAMDGLPSPPYPAFAAAGSQVCAASMSYGAPFGPYVHQWDGTNWTPLGGGIWGTFGVEGSTPVRALAIHGTDVYVGGIFDQVGGVQVTNLARWDGTNWWSVGGGVWFEEPNPGPATGVYALAFQGQDLIVGGYFNRVGGSPVNYLAKWDGTNWCSFGGGPGDIVTILAVSGDELYVSSTMKSGIGLMANGLARWNGTAWSGLGSGINPMVQALAVSGADLYIGCGYYDVGPEKAGGVSRWPIPQRLQFSRLGGQLTLAWPTQAVDFVLQSSATLPGTDWSTVPPPPVVVNGHYTFTTNLSGGTRFFRLQRPY